MSNPKLTDRLTTALDPIGARALIAIIEATRALAAAAHPIEHWHIDWTRGVVRAFNDIASTERDNDGLPLIITIIVEGLIPTTAIRLADELTLEEHCWLTIADGAVWTIGDLAMHDRRTPEIMQRLCNVSALQRAWSRLRTEFPETYQEWTGSPAEDGPRSA